MASRATPRVVLAGSQKAPLRGAKSAGKIDPRERIEVTVRVRAREAVDRSPELATLAATAPARRRPLSREEFAARFGANPEDLERVEEFAHEHGLDVVGRSAAQRTIRLSGTVQAMQEAFGVRIKAMVHNKVRFRHRSGAIRIPKDLAPIVEGVFGLDNRPAVRPHFRFKPARGRQPRTPNARPFTPVEVAKLYGFPAGLDGSGECIAILEFGGGYKTTDLKKYFAKLGIQTPKVSAVSVDGGHNHPTGSPDGPDGEVMLDIEVAGAVAPKARIAVYFAPNTDDGFIDALRAAVHDAQRRPSVVSISWGSPELGSTQQSVLDYDAVCQEAAVMGVTICCSAGDHGTDDTPQPSPRANVDFPASSPHVLACGGTHLESSNGAISGETVWNTHDGWATGGGVSEVFPLPSWQAAAHVPTSANPGGKVGRGVPDVSGDADADTGYIIRVDGTEGPTGGTSAVAPLWAGLVALLNQGLGKPVGFINPLLYQSPNNVNCFRDVVAGDNAAFPSSKKYAARSGWDACTGWGSPKGAALLAAVKA
ncbi:MAG TPA: S53 family peptidase [Vicinamibacteria bacterium]|nr:S53 family peptidase [Vicinamibacteria bacterium]